MVQFLSFFLTARVFLMNTAYVWSKKKSFVEQMNNFLLDIPEFEIARKRICFVRFRIYFLNYLAGTWFQWNLEHSYFYVVWKAVSLRAKLVDIFSTKNFSIANVLKVKTLCTVQAEVAGFEPSISSTLASDATVAPTFSEIS